jgi:hypothetical protein
VLAHTDLQQSKLGFVHDETRSKGEHDSDYDEGFDDV